MRTPWIFDVGASIYDTITRSPRWRAHCREMAPLIAGPLVLDLGIGPGVSGIEMASVAPRTTFVGADISRPMLARAARHVADAGITLPLVRADAARLPFRDGAFDGATGHSFLYLLADAAAVLTEVRRVVKPGGRVAFLEPRAIATRARAAAVVRSAAGGWRFATSMFLWSVVSGLHGRPTDEALAARLAAAGFADVSTTPALDGLGVVGAARRP